MTDGEEGRHGAGSRRLAGRFEDCRAHLRAVSYRMLGSPAEADDLVQEAWLRISRADTSEVENLGAWLTTVVARVCLDMLRSRAARREEPLERLERGEHLGHRRRIRRPVVTRCCGNLALRR